MFGFSTKQLVIVAVLVIVVARYAKTHTLPLIG